MKISIIIITWNQLPVLRNCLISLETIMARNDVEVIITDNGSKDGTADFLKREYPKITLVELNENKGVSFARNRALEKSGGEYIFVLDNDTVVSEEAVKGMENFMEEHPKAGICGCRLIDADNLVQDSAKKYPSLKEKIANVLKGKKYRYSYSKELRSKIFEPVYLIGACQFIRRKAYEQVGLLDEKIFYGPEDADFCIRIKEAGWSIFFLPQYSITHLCRRMTNRKLFSKMAFIHIKALLYLYRKHKHL